MGLIDLNILLINLISKCILEYIRGAGSEWQQSLLSRLKEAGIAVLIRTLEMLLIGYCFVVISDQTKGCSY